MGKYKIIQERDKCIGCGSCVAVCPKNWEMKDDGLSCPKQDEVDEVGCNRQAEEICPAECIHIKEI